MLAIYCRHSKTKKEGKDTSIATQQKYGRELADFLNLDYEYYLDKGISGTSIEKRDEMIRLLGDIKQGRISAFYAYDQDRVERDTSFWLEFCSIIIANNVRYFENTREIDLREPSNAMSTTMKSAFSAYYAAQTSKAVKNSIKRNAERGKVRGILPYGYTKDDEGFVVIHEEQAKIVAKIYDWSLSGLGSYTISNILNNDGVPTKFNEFEGVIKRKADKYTEEREFKKSEVRWRGNVIYDMIKNESYKGIKRVGNIIVDIPAIVSEEKWNKTVSNLEKNKRNVGPKNQYHYLLNGLVYCHHCGRPIIGKKRLKGRDNAYKCSGKKYPNPDCTESRGLNIPKLDTFVIKMLFESHDLTDYLLSLPEKYGMVDNLKQKLSQYEIDLKKINKKINNGYDELLGAEEVRKQRLRSRLDKLEREERGLTENIQLLTLKIKESVKSERDETIRKATKGYDKELGFDALKDLVHLVIDKIVVKHVVKEKEDIEKSHHVLFIKYKGFDEQLVIQTNNFLACNWSGMIFNNINNVEELAPHKIEIDWKKVVNQETLMMPMHSFMLSLKKDELINFD